MMCCIWALIRLENDKLVFINLIVELQKYQNKTILTQ